MRIGNEELKMLEDGWCIRGFDIPRGFLTTVIPDLAMAGTCASIGDKTRDVNDAGSTASVASHCSAGLFCVSAGQRLLLFPKS